MLKSDIKGTKHKKGHNSGNLSYSLSSPFPFSLQTTNTGLVVSMGSHQPLGSFADHSVPLLAPLHNQSQVALSQGKPRAPRGVGEHGDGLRRRSLAFFFLAAECRQRSVCVIFSQVCLLLVTNQSIIALLSWMDYFSLCKSWIGAPNQIQIFHLSSPRWL